VALVKCLLEKCNDLEISQQQQQRSSSNSNSNISSSSNTQHTNVATVLVFRTSVAICFAQVWVVK